MGLTPHLRELCRSPANRLNKQTERRGDAALSALVRTLRDKWAVSTGGC